MVTELLVGIPTVTAVVLGIYCWYVRGKRRTAEHERDQVKAQLTTTENVLKVERVISQDRATRVKLLEAALLNRQAEEHAHDEKVVTDPADLLGGLRRGGTPRR